MTQSWKHFSSRCLWEAPDGRLLGFLAVDFEHGRGFRFSVRAPDSMAELAGGHRDTWAAAAKEAERQALRLLGPGGEGAAYAA